MRYGGNLEVCDCSQHVEGCMKVVSVLRGAGVLGAGGAGPGRQEVVGPPASCGAHRPQSPHQILIPCAYDAHTHTQSSYPDQVEAMVLQNCIIHMMCCLWNFFIAAVV